MIKLSELKKYDIYHRENIALLRDHYKKAVFSLDRQHKAQIYFEYDCQSSGTFVDFTNNKGELLKRIQLKEADSNTNYYWFFSIEEQVAYNCTRANEQNPHLLFELGKSFIKED